MGGARALRGQGGTAGQALLPHPPRPPSGLLIMNPLNQGLLMGEWGKWGGRAHRESDTPVTSKPPTMVAPPWGSP